jgi:hypothetical protein
MSRPHLHLNPGGQLSASQVVGREDLIAQLWGDLRVRSGVLSAERRMGKTSVLSKMLAETPSDFVAVRRDVEGVRSAEEFTEQVCTALRESFTGSQKLASKMANFISKLGITDVGPIKLDFTVQSWKVTLHEVCRQAEACHEELFVVVLLDEIPYMLDSLEDPVAREVMDVLREIRSSCSRLRFVLCGSIGLHHVLQRLRAPGRSWAPINDMWQCDLPVLAEKDAVELALDLLSNADVTCSESIAVAQTIAAEACCVPYYVHCAVKELRDHADGPVDAGTARKLFRAAAEHTDDPLQLRHYVERVPAYFPDDQEVVHAVLDAVSSKDAGLPFDELQRVVGTQVGVEEQRLRNVLDLLERDHYTERPKGRIRFRLPIVRRAWRHFRYL